jgi:hypothetical protein
MEKLYRLRLVFIIYFIAKVIVDVAFGSNISIPVRSNIEISPMVFYVIAIFINLILFLIGLMLFYFLLNKKNWARIVLLIVGWLAVADVFVSMIFSSNINQILKYFGSYTDWNKLLLLDRVTDILGLFFWGYAIYILQFSSDVRKIFLPERDGGLVR